MKTVFARVGDFFGLGVHESFQRRGRNSFLAQILDSGSEWICQLRFVFPTIMPNKSSKNNLKHFQNYIRHVSYRSRDGGVRQFHVRQFSLHITLGQLGPHLPVKEPFQQVFKKHVLKCEASAWRVRAAEESKGTDFTWKRTDR